MTSRGPLLASRSASAGGVYGGPSSESERQPPIAISAFMNPKTFCMPEPLQSSSWLPAEKVVSSELRLPRSSAPQNIASQCTSYSSHWWRNTWESARLHTQANE